jgi:hypothetical protein
MLILAAGKAGAQTQPVGTSTPEPLTLVIVHTNAGARIRFVTHGGGRTVADDPQVVNDSMQVKVNGHLLAFPLAQIDTLWVSNGRNAGRGAMIVGIPFAVLGAIVGASFACGIDRTPSCNDAHNTYGGAALFATILGAPAALVGALIGSAIVRWKQVYVRAAA